MSRFEGGDEEDAFERDVAAAGRPWNVVFFHVPPFSAYRGAADVHDG